MKNTKKYIYGLLFILIFISLPLNIFGQGSRPSFISELINPDNYYLNYYSIPVLTSCFILFFIGTFVLIKDIRSKINIVFFFFMLAVCTWLFCQGMQYNAVNYRVAFFFGRFMFIGIPFIGVNGFLLSLIYRNRILKKSLLNTILLVIGYIGATGFALSTYLTDKFIVYSKLYYWGYFPMFGLLGYFFMAFFFFYMLMVLTTLWISFKNSKNQTERTNLKFLLISLSVALIGAADYLPQFNIAIYPFGFFPIMLFSVINMIGIVKHKMFDIETVFHKTLLWVAMSAVIIFPLGAVIYLLYPFLEEMNVMQITGVAVLLFILMRVYYNKVQPLVDHIFQRRKYNYRALLDEFLEKISTLNNVYKLTDQTRNMLQNTLYSEEVNTYLVGNETMMLIERNAKQAVTVKIKNKAIDWIQKKVEPIEKELLNSDPRYIDIKQELLDLFNKLKEILLVPVIHNGKLQALIGLGKKRNMKSYSHMDVKFLRDLSLEVGIALTNSLMFETVEKQNRELKELDKLKSDFLANTSHELRTPLNGIIGLSEAMLEGADGPINTKLKDHLSMVIGSANNLKDLVNVILDMSKMQSGKQDFIIKKFSIKSIIDDAEPSIEGLLIKKPIELKLDIKKDCKDVYVDKDKIRQVLINIIGNAVKFTEKGFIRITAEPDKKNKDSVLISIEDTGIGIKEDHLGIIFDEFRQVDGSSSRKYEGTGLGLAITKKILTSLGGTIWAESKPGKGSTFYFTLPTKPGMKVKAEKKADIGTILPPAPEITEKRKESKDFDPFTKGFMVEDDDGKKDILKFPKGKGEKILIVDDIEINLEALAMNLMEKGYNVTKALSADEALKLLNTGLYNLIISDVMMPEMDGYTLVQKIRGQEKYHSVPVILLTAKTRLEDKRKGFEVGADDYIVKPFEIGELLLRIRNALEHKGAVSVKPVYTDDTEYDVDKSDRFRKLHKGNQELILAIDDNKVNLEVVKSRLEMNNWKVEMAMNGEEGIEKYQKTRPDLILLDIMMPGIDGYEVCKRIRYKYRGDMVPIIFLTAKQEQEDKIYGINVGGDDYITKPFDKNELVIRVSNHLHNRKMILEVKEKELMERDIIMAGEIQQKLLPTSLPKNEKIEFIGSSLAAKGVGGDYFDIIPIKNNRYLCVIADVMGKGMSAALVMVKIQTLLRSITREETIDLKEIVKNINSIMYADMEGDKFVTMFLMIYDTKSNEIEYISAGHDQVLFYNDKNKKIKKLKADIHAIGIANTYKEIRTNRSTFASGDIFLMYTDGVSEAMNRERKQYGEKRIMDLVKNYHDKSASSVYKTIIDEVAEYTKDVDQHDDITLVIGKIK